MTKKRKWSFPFLLIISFIIILFSGCASKPPAPVSSEFKLGSITDYLKKNISENIEIINAVYTDISSVDNTESCNAKITYKYGDITYCRVYSLSFKYSKAFGWSAEEFLPEYKNMWTEEGQKPAKNSILSDLENKSYLSGYSDGLFENKRVLSFNITSDEFSVEEGYYRVNLTSTLNADNVHENLTIYCEYLLNSDNIFELSTSDITLESVKVQGKVSTDMIKESLQTVSFYREEEISTWRIGDLNKLNFDILEDNLDTSTNSEVVTLTFRGEGEFMYVSGKVTLTFHFSSGWYLYDSAVDMDSIESEMLNDGWIADEELLTATIINDHPLSYGMVEDFKIEEDMISKLEITNKKITEKGRFQTVYFSYLLTVKSTIFSMSGYCKYDLTDSTLKVVTWNETIDDVEFNISGKWCGYDVSNEYIAYYSMDLNDSKNGSLSGTLSAFGVDYKKDPKKIFSFKIKIIGNLFSGMKFEIMDQEYISGEKTSSLIIPIGYYDFTKEALIVTNGISGDMRLTKTEDELSIDTFIEITKSDGLGEYIKNILNMKDNTNI